MPASLPWPKAGEPVKLDAFFLGVLRIPPSEELQILPPRKEGI
jgi:hypothetical protein